MTVRHTPHGSGHPYRFDLDQRVPTTPMKGEPFEIRVVTDTSVDTVTVAFDDGRAIEAVRVRAADLVEEHGPPAAGVTEAGHLAPSAVGASDGETLDVWRAIARAEERTSYRVIASTAGAEIRTGLFAIDPASWSPVGGSLHITGNDERLDRGSIRWLVNANATLRVRFRLRLDPAQHIAGLGERFEALDHRGRVLDAVVFEQYKHQGNRTYLPAPMGVVVGGSHWGFHLDTTHRTWFDLGAAEPDWLAIEAEVDPENPYLDVGLWDGEPHTIVKRFLERAGQPKLAPEWVFEPWISGNEWNTQARVETEVERSLEENIPVGVIVIEAWSDESTFVAFRDAQYDVHPNGEPHQLEDFTFPPEGAWPDPVGMVDRLHKKGVKVLLWQIPLIPTDRVDDGQVQADLDTLERRAFCVHNGNGSPHHNRGWWFPGALLPDFTNPEVREWWSAKRRYLLDDVCIDGFKTDGGEHLWGHDLVFADGTRGAETNNRFPVLYSQTYHELMDKAGVQGVTFSRAGFAGSAAFPCHWAGDEDSTWEAFRSSILAGLSAGIAGIYYWGWDIAGFSGAIPDPELYLRSTAMATFSPIMQYHSEYNHHRRPTVDRTPWNIAERWQDPSVIDVYRVFAQLRLRLVPYLAAQAKKSITAAKPLMRPLFFDYPDDENIWASPLQYQLGDDLIVAPITGPNIETVDVYLPEGDWVDCYNGNRYSGPTRTTRRVPLNEIAAYRRGEAPALAAAFPSRSRGEK